ncbi:MAG: phage holin family protein [Bacteroidota bacterium]
MEELKKSATEAINDLKTYAENTVDLYKLQAVEKGSQMGASMIVYIIIGTFAGLSVIFLSLFAALWLNEKLNSPYFGFLCVAGAYLLITLILWTGRNGWLKNMFTDSIIQSIFNQES